MGLDMYAARRVYVKQWDHQRPDERYTVQIACGGKPVPGIQADRISAIEEEVMYWRKANHIHAWFVENVQDGTDNCASYYVNPDKIRDLFVLCTKVIEASTLVDGEVEEATVYCREHPNGVVQRTPGKVIQDATVAMDLLPIEDGFFFGGTEYGEDYLDDVVQTREWAGRMIADDEDGVPGTIYYSSSW